MADSTSVCPRCCQSVQSYWLETTKRLYGAAMCSYCAQAIGPIDQDALRKEYVMRFLQKNPCLICGENNLQVLEFHHREPKTKKFDISTAIAQNKSIELLQAEIEKCDVLCGNCHKIIEDLEHNTWRVGYKITPKYFTGEEIPQRPRLPKEAARIKKFHAEDEEN